MPIKAPAYVAPPPSWTGFYVGLNAGWAGSQNSVNSVATPVPDATLGVIPGVSAGLAALSTGSVHAGNRSGFIGGGQVGYNWQLGSFVAGIGEPLRPSVAVRSSILHASLHPPRHAARSPVQGVV